MTRPRGLPFARAWLAAGLLACSAAPRPPDAEIHRLAASALREELAAPSPVLLHPLLIQRDTGGAPSLEHAVFNAFDSSSVAEVIAGGSSAFTLCRTSTTGSCEVPRGSVAILLSELQDLGENGLAVWAVVLDGREGRAHQRYFRVRVSARSGGWEVVEVTSVP